MRDEKLTKEKVKVNGKSESEMQKLIQDKAKAYSIIQPAWKAGAPAAKDPRSQQ